MSERYYAPAGNPELWIYSLNVINQTKASGRVILASADVNVCGIAIIGVLLTKNCAGDVLLALPRGRGNSPALLFSNRGLQARLMAKCINSYRKLAGDRGLDDLLAEAS